MIDVVTSNYAVTQVLRDDSCNDTSVTHTFLASLNLPKYARTCLLRCLSPKRLTLVKIVVFSRYTILTYIFQDTLGT